MKNLLAAILCFGVIFAYSNPANAQGKKKNEIEKPKNYQPLTPANSPELQTLLNHVIEETLAKFPDFKREEMAATLIDLRDANKIAQANVRGEEKIYPASVVKLFYLAALERQLEDGKIKDTPELERGVKDMIVVSSNEATQYILDAVTDSSSGAELDGKEYSEWSFKRNKVNRFFASLDYQNINTNQKTFCEDAYGREQEFRGANGENRNKLTTDATARLLAEIVAGKIASAETTQKMLNLLKRDPFAATTDADDQGHGFSGKMLADRKMTDAKIWSKAGWTSKTRHDAAYIETADGLKFVLVIFTENHASEREFIPTFAGKIVDGLREIK